MHELHGECRGKGSVPCLAKTIEGGFRDMSADAQQPVGRRVGIVPRGPAARDLLREPSQILDHHDLQRDRYGPELADRQRLHILVGIDETDEDVGIEAAVGMRDERPRNPEHARIAGEGPREEFRELAIISRR